MHAFHAPGRRQFLGSAGAAALLGAVPALAHATQGSSTSFVPDLELALRAAPDQVGIFRGPATQVWRYHAKVIKGDASAVTTLTDSYLGPIIRVRRGMRVRIHFINQLPQPSVVHWHGMLDDLAGQGIRPDGLQRAGGCRWQIPPGHDTRGNQPWQ